MPRLGSTAIDVATQGKSRASVPFRLPPHAQQGPHRWYLIHLHFVIVFARDTGSGLAYVSGLTAGRTSAQVQFRVRRNGPHPKIVWDSLGLVNGEVRRVSSSRRVEVGFKNYLVYAGVRPGANDLSVQLEALEPQVKVSRLRVSRDSGLIVTDRSPPALAVRAAPPTRDVEPGEAFEVPFTVVNRGERSAPDAAVSLGHLPRGLTSVGPTTHSFDHVAGLSEEGGEFRVRAHREGDYQLDLEAVGGAQHTEATVDIPVVATQPASGGDGMRIALGGVIVAGGLGALVASRRRRHNGAE